MLIVILTSFALIVATVMIHYELLRGTSRLIPKLSIPPRSRIFVVISAVFVAHFIEVCLYALAYHVMSTQGLGAIDGKTEGNALDLFYFSISTYTTLGIGDLHAVGPIRLIAGIESLNGLVLIGWSASFTYLAMERFWEAHRHAASVRAKGHHTE
jgi:hypothetical protein